MFSIFFEKITCTGPLSFIFNIFSKDGNIFDINFSNNLYNLLYAKIFGKLFISELIFTLYRR